MRRFSINSAATFCLAILILSRVVAQSATEQRPAGKDEQKASEPAQPHAIATSSEETSLLESDLPAAEVAELNRAIPNTVRPQESDSASPAPGALKTALVAWANLWSRPEYADLPTQLRAAKNSFKPVAKADVLTRQVALESAVRRLDRYLKSNAALGDGWRKYLHLPELQAEMQKGISASLQALHQLAVRFADGSPGLELTQFVAVRTALENYTDLLAAYQQRDSSKAQFENDLDTLATGLEQVAFRRGNVDRGPIGEVLARVATTGQVPKLVSAVQQQLAQPNILILASGDIVAGGIDDDVNENTPVDDVILGTQIHGQGRTAGHIKSVLVPNRDKATIEIQLKGTTLARTVGHNGPVTIFSHSNTSLDGHKRIDLDDKQFLGDAAWACCCTHSCIDCLDICGGFIIRHIATKRVYGSKATGEAIAGQHAEVRLENRMNSRTADMLANANRTFDERFRDPLTRLGAYPQYLRFSTTSDWLAVSGLQARENELGANTTPPERVSNAALSIRMHETLVDNFAAVLSPGKTARSLAYRRMMRDFLSEPYQRGEFDDFLICLAETGAPLDHRDDALAIKFDQFKSLMKDRFDLTVTETEFQKLVRAMNQATMTEDQYNKYLVRLAKEPVKYDDAMHLLAEYKRGDVQPNYSAMTFADQEPISVKFENGQFKLTMRVKSFVQPKLDGDGKRIVNPYPAEIFVTYNLEMRGGRVIATRVDGQYGVKGLPLSEQDENNLTLREKTRRSTLLTKTLPRRFFGAGEATDRDDEDISAEPIFPPEKESTGLTLRGRWKRLGELPWAQIVSENGWLALGWSMPEAKGKTE